MTLRHGSLFSGYGGLDMGVQSVLGGSTAWHVEFDKHPSVLLAHHWPDVPNYGDITKVDFTAVEPVDVLTGGFPCQDVSHAGRRAGLIRDGEGRTRSGLWGEMLRAITELRPRLVVAENVRGLLSAAADSDVEPCPWCLGDANGEPDMRALGAVLADLADVGYDAWWVGLRAADVGAAHGRFRVFIFAAPATDATSGGAFAGQLSGQPCGPEPVRDDAPVVLLPTPRTSDTNGAGTHGTGGPDLRTVAATLLPTPRATDGTKGGPNQRGSSGDLMLPSAVQLLPTPTTTQRGTDANLDTREGARANLHNEVALLPTPSVADVEGGRKHRSGDRSDELLLNGLAAKWGEEARLLPTPSASQAGGTAEAHRERKRRSMGRTDPTCADLGLLVADHATRWGDYAPAIARWEHVLGRPAPAPTEPGPKGSPRLSAHFVEWMMGLPLGWVTDVDVPRNAQLKALGNGVVPQQAAAACHWWLSQIRSAAA